MLPGTGYSAAVFSACPKGIHGQLLAFDEFGRKTVVLDDGMVPIYVNEFWTSRQRAAHSLHEISYRACFKPQLPRFLIKRLSRPGDMVYDPFMGRGTTLLEASLLGRRPAGGDLNPLSSRLLKPRLCPPILDAVEKRLSQSGRPDSQRIQASRCLSSRPSSACASSGDIRQVRR